MAEQTTASIDIDASPEDVLAVIADFPAYPQWVDNLVTATVLSETDGYADQVRMVLKHPMITDDYTLAYDWADNKVSWHLIEAKQLKAMDGSYTLQPTGDGTRVTYALKVDIKLPMLGALKRKAEKTIVDGALKGLKERVESR
ncbi:cyclase [Enemella dayhoffiae]|uniref:Cyclase n=1 Tax=Enemella dayhoffiae TaxID=2016507 RepID=A0A255HAD9_9ACTN|nr:SRPBCC family protein [Enemella dayhoffiae]OYO24621.1 cyclase [Enemella dayhoffiae]